jgi:glycerol uptake facilitator-like aquaporin
LIAVVRLFARSHQKPTEESAPSVIGLELCNSHFTGQFLTEVLHNPARPCRITGLELGEVPGLS